MVKLFDNIPVVDLSMMDGDENSKKEFAKLVGEAYENFGFASVINHGLSDDMQAKLYDLWKKFYASDMQEKLKLALPDNQFQRGYTPPQSEQAVGHDVPDEKEFYHVGQPDDVIDAGGYNYLRNVWPEDMPELKELSMQAFKILEQAAAKMLRGIAIYLDLDEDYFQDKVIGGNSVLRPIHYYPVDPETVDEDAMRAAEHGDINFITLLMGASAGGLQVLRADGKWIDVTVVPDALVCNVGDMLDRLTNHKLKSTLHRVIMPPKEEMNKPRYSMPFFMHAKSDVSLKCLPNCVDVDNPKRYEDTTVGEFLTERLAQIMKK